MLKCIENSQLGNTDVIPNWLPSSPPSTVEAGLGGSADLVAVLEGDPVTLVCGTDLTGNPTPLVQWTDNNGR